MTEKTWMSADVYTDIQGLNAIRQRMKDNPELAKKDVSKQFESLLLQMLLKSMREGTRAINADQDEGEHKALYEDWFDNQLALSMSQTGIGLADLIEQSINKAQEKVKPMVDVKESQPANKLATDDTKSQKKNVLFNSMEEFISSLWSLSKGVASLIGADPRILLAQAALETNWGKNIISHVTGESSYNLFNIKADKSWAKKTVSASTQEFDGKTMSHTDSHFRSYQSFAESFKDYIHFLQTNPRYQEALKHASVPEQFVSLLQKANFATDPDYAKKIMQIYRNIPRLFQNAKF